MFSRYVIFSFNLFFLFCFYSVFVGSVFLYLLIMYLFGFYFGVRYKEYFCIPFFVKVFKSGFFRDGGSSG